MAKETTETISDVDQDAATGEGMSEPIEGDGGDTPETPVEPDSE